ncbi:MAG: acyl-CoA thioesterase [Sphingomonadales bacterium]
MSLQFEHSIRVRYAECDRMGFVHHSAYVLYFEEARTEAMRSMGLNYKEMEDAGIIMPVRAFNIEFKKAGRYDDLLKIIVKITEKPAIRCHFEYHTYNQEGEHLNSGFTELFFVKKDSLRPTPLPAFFANVIDKHFEP